MYRLCSLLAIIVVWAEYQYYRERASPAIRITSNKAHFLQWQQPESLQQSLMRHGISHI